GGDIANLRCVSFHGRALHLVLRTRHERNRGGGGDVDRWVFLCDGIGVPGGCDRVIEQSDFGADAFDHHRGRAADAGAGRFGNGRSAGGAGRGGGGLRLSGGWG